CSEEDPPGPADPAIRRIHGARGARCGSAHVGNTGCGPKAPPAPRNAWYRWLGAGSTSVLVGHEAAHAPIALGLVEGPVRCRDELGRGPSVDREGGGPDRGCDRHGPALLTNERLLAERVEDALCRAGGVATVGLGQDHGELVAAVPSRDVRGPPRGSEQLRVPRPRAASR